MSISQKRKILVITDATHAFSGRKGGVQICTEEYLSLLRKADFEVIVHSISHTRKVFQRIKIKLGLDVYSRYDFKDLLGDIAQKIREEKIDYIALNQVGLSGFAKPLKEIFGNGVKIITLSHGNESGDFVHEIVRTENKSIFSKARDITRLGFFIFNESRYFTEDIDLVLSMSRTELEINRWLGAKNVMFVPRIFSPNFLAFNPDRRRIGFVGTLDHLPNKLGLEKFLVEFEKENAGNIKLRLIGGPESAGRSFQHRFSCVEYLGILEDQDLQREATTWACSINPIFWYSRGASTKLAQLLDWGMPLVTTEAGNRGYVWKQGKLLTATDAKDMARKVFDLASSEGSVVSNAEQSRLVACSGPSVEELAGELKGILANI